MKIRRIVAFIAFLAAIAFTSMAHAATTPTSGQLAYSVYDIVMNQVIGGPIGYVIGATGLATGIGTGMFTPNLKASIITTTLSAVWLGFTTVMTTMGALY